MLHAQVTHIVSSDDTCCMIRLHMLHAQVTHVSVSVNTRLNCRGCVLHTQVMCVARLGDGMTHVACSNETRISFR